jgi:integrase/recombinase XerD
VPFALGRSGAQQNGIGKEASQTSARSKGNSGRLEHEVPCRHNLEQYLDEYIADAGITSDPNAPLFQTAGNKSGALTGNAMWQRDAYRMIQGRARPAGIKTRIGNHTFRATGITA